MSSSVLTLRAVLGLDSSEYDKGLDDSSNKANSFAGKLKNVFGAAAKATAVAFTAAAAGVAALTKAAVNSYAEYEQLAGGIEKLFGKENAEIVAKYAEQAYLTSGKSINEYYNSVSQITASLKRSIGDDMEEVARVADIAMQVISDNVNTFGSDAEFVENAIMGLSRQNYTMIDNLKLGYAGTAQGMLELINDSGVLGRTLKDTSELATVGFDQMILAIQKVQEQQGIAGTTAKEAMKTIQGSAKAAKSAWQNLITAIGRGEGIDEALSSLESVLFSEDKEQGLVNLLVTRIQKVIPGIAKMAVGMLGQIVPKIISEIGPIINSTMPMIIESVQSIITAIIETLPQITEAISSFLPQIVGSLLTLYPQFINAGITMILSLIQGLTQGLPELMGMLPSIITDIATMALSLIPQLVETAQQLIISVLEGAAVALPELISALPGLIDAGIGVIDALLKGTFANLPKILDAGVEVVFALIDGIVANLPQLVAKVPEIITTIVSVLTQNLPLIIEKGFEVVIKLAEGLISAIPELVKEVPTIVAAILKAFGEGLSGMFDIGASLVEGLWNGIASVKDWIMSKIRGFGSSIVSGIKSFFGIHSPSTLFRDQIGKNLALGLEVGFEKYLPVAEMVDAVQDAVDEINDAGVNALEDDYITMPETMTTTTTNSSVGVAGGITINVYGGDKDVSEIVDEVIDAIESNLMMTRRVYQ